MKLTSLITMAFALAAGAAAAAQERTLPPVVFAGGRVTVQASEVPARDVLAAWAGAGQVEVTGADLLGGRVVTLSLQDADELSALQAIIGEGVGFVATAKTEYAADRSRLARITIGGAKTRLATAAPPAAVDPEAKYSYYTPEKSGPSLGATSSPAPNAVPPAPETRFEYSAPAKAADGPKLIAPDVISVDPKLAAPESRFQYYVPGKIKQ